MNLTTEDVINCLNEIVDPDSIDVDVLAKKDHLCPDIWDSDDKMNPEVRKYLLKNAKAFIEYLDLDDMKFDDITLTGSLANYNWTEHSDLDVHVLLPYNEISDNNEIVFEYFRAKKSIWATKVPVTVKGHDIEMFIQDTESEHTSTGIYSLMQDKWLTKPIKTMISVDTNNVKEKVADIMNKIDELEKIKNSDRLINISTELMNKLRKMRQAGLDKEGEFSTENLVFKVLRNQGYLDKLADIKNKTITNDLVLDETWKTTIQEGSVKERIRKAKQAGTLTFSIIVSLIAAGVTVNDMIDSGVPQEIINKAVDFVEAEVPEIIKNIELDK